MSRAHPQKHVNPHGEEGKSISPCFVLLFLSLDSCLVAKARHPWPRSSECLLMWLTGAGTAGVFWKKSRHSVFKCKSTLPLACSQPFQECIVRTLVCTESLSPGSRGCEARCTRVLLRRTRGPVSCQPPARWCGCITCPPRESLGRRDPSFRRTFQEPETWKAWSGWRSVEGTNKGSLRCVVRWSHVCTERRWIHGLCLRIAQNGGGIQRKWCIISPVTQSVK